jgi:hypothetical protein
MHKNSFESNAAAEGTCKPVLHDAGLPANAHADDNRASACDTCTAEALPLATGEATNAFKMWGHK